MSKQVPHLLRMVMKNGHPINLYADDATVDELIAHPKFVSMKDDVNDIYVSIEDISAFEIFSNRKEEPKGDGNPCTETCQNQA